MLEIEKLSEKNLYDVLCYIFPDVIVEHNKMIQDAHRKYFVDYYFELSNHIVIVEFDGPRHFCNTLNEIRDRDLTNWCKLNKYILIRIPYFIQIDDRSLIYYFNHDIFEKYPFIDVVNSKYKNGFWDKKIVFPSDFNSYGFNIFYELYEDLCRKDEFSIVKEIWDSLDEVGFDISLGIDYRDDPNKATLADNYPT